MSGEISSVTQLSNGGTRKMGRYESLESCVYSIRGHATLYLNQLIISHDTKLYGLCHKTFIMYACDLNE